MTQYIFPEGIPSESCVGIPTIRKEGDVPTQKEDHPFHRLLDLASSNERVWKVLRLIGSRRLDWVTLYRIYEVIKKDVRDVSKKGWATRGSLRVFSTTANHPAVSGDDARHGESNKIPPSVPMEIEKARALIRRIVDRWLKEKMRT